MKTDQTLVLDFSRFKLAARKAVLRVNRLVSPSCDFDRNLALFKMLHYRSRRRLEIRLLIQL